jgi:hypothetical protein
MPDEVITSTEQITTGWLTAVLKNNGALSEGLVTSFELEEGEGNWSENANLKIIYNDDARGAMPERLFLKMVDTGTIV